MPEAYIPLVRQSTSRAIPRIVIALLLGALAGLAPASTLAVPQPGEDKALNKQIDNLQKKTIDAEASAFVTVGTLAEQLKAQTDRARKELANEAVKPMNLDLPRATVTDVEKTRARLKRDAGEWLQTIDYVETAELKKGIADALAVAKADFLDVRKYTDLYERTKAVVRGTTFRVTGTTMADRLKNLDLERDAIDQRLKELAAKRKVLIKAAEAAIPAVSRSANPWTRSTAEWKVDRLGLELIGVEFEILQHLLNVRHEDISAPLYNVMDGLLSSFVWLGSWTTSGKNILKVTGLEGHAFDSAAVRATAEQYAVKLVTLGYEGEALAAEARAARQKHRENHYKRAAIAYIRALISSDERVPCQIEEQVSAAIEFAGEKIRTLQCPDPVVKHLREYLDAMRNYQSADVDRLVAEGEQLVAAQQVIVDFMAAVPVAGDLMDFYSVVSGETLSGKELGPFERLAIGTLTSLPLVGPHALPYVAKWIPVSRSKSLIAVQEYMVSLFEFGGQALRESHAARHEVIAGVTEMFGDMAGVPRDKLKRLYIYFKDTPYELTPAARIRMKVFQTVRDAAEDRIAVAALKNSPEYAAVFRRAMEESSQTLEHSLLRPYNRTWAESAAASHIPVRQLEEFEKLARSRGEAYVFRPVGADAAELIETNFAATKPLHIKPKSANWGPQSAYIPVDQELSKLGNPAARRGSGRSAEEIAKEIGEYQAKAQACLASKCARDVPLTIKRAPNGTEVMEEFEVMVVNKQGQKTPILRDSEGVLRDPDTFRPLAAGEVDTSTMTQLRVFADENGVPITADFDGLAFGSRRRLEGATGLQGTGFDAAARRRAPRAAGASGTISAETAGIVKEINEAARRAGYEQGKVVHHGAEVFNPGSKEVFTDSEIFDRLRLSVIDPDHGLLTIPACNKACMVRWCEKGRLCDPRKICGVRNAPTACIPIDRDRLVKDYFQNARLRGIDLFPHPSWKWGRYNGNSGWTLTSFLDDVPANGFERIHPSARANSSAYAELKMVSGYFGAVLAYAQRTGHRLVRQFDTDDAWAAPQ